MVELQSEDEKKAEVVGKVDNNEEQANKEQTENENMILNKDGNTEKNKSEGEPKAEDEQYGKPNQQEKEKKSWEIKTSTREEDQNKNTSKTIKLETTHFKLHQETLVDKKIEPELKEEEPNGNWTTTKKR